MNELLTWLAMWLTPGALVFAWIRADEWLACPADESPSEQNHRLDTEAAAASGVSG